MPPDSLPWLPVVNLQVVVVVVGERFTHFVQFIGVVGGSESGAKTF